VCVDHDLDAHGRPGADSRRDPAWRRRPPRRVTGPTAPPARRAFLGTDLRRGRCRTPAQRYTDWPRLDGTGQLDPREHYEPARRAQPPRHQTVRSSSCGARSRSCSLPRPQPSLRTGKTARSKSGLRASTPRLTPSSFPNAAPGRRPPRPPRSHAACKRSAREMRRELVHQNLIAARLSTKRSGALPWRGFHRGGSRSAMVRAVSQRLASRFWRRDCCRCPGHRSDEGRRYLRACHRSGSGHDNRRGDLRRPYLAAVSGRHRGERDRTSNRSRQDCAPAKVHVGQHGSRPGPIRTPPDQPRWTVPSRLRSADHSQRRWHDHRSRGADPRRLQRDATPCVRYMAVQGNFPRRRRRRDRHVRLGRRRLACQAVMAPHYDALTTGVVGSTCGRSAARSRQSTGPTTMPLVSSPVRRKTHGGSYSLTIVISAWETRLVPRSVSTVLRLPTLAACVACAIAPMSAAPAAAHTRKAASVPAAAAGSRIPIPHITFRPVYVVRIPRYSIHPPYRYKPPP
jgi:hypothetical protein